MDEVFCDGETSTLFLLRDVQLGSASHKYCLALAHLFKIIGTIIYEFIRPGHANVHGTRKGAAVAAISGTTYPPPPSSIARCGEWSLGNGVLERSLIFVGFFPNLVTNIAAKI